MKKYIEGTILFGIALLAFAVAFVAAPFVAAWRWLRG